MGWWLVRHLRLMVTADYHWSMAASTGLAFLAQVLVGELVGPGLVVLGQPVLALVVLVVALALALVGEPGSAA